MTEVAADQQTDAVQLTSWELGQLRHQASANALTYLQHKARGQLRGDELQECDRWVALAKKLSDATPSNTEGK